MKRVLKLKIRHPRRSYRLQNHVIEPQYKEFDLNEKEELELKTKGCKHWIMEKPKQEEKKEEKKEEPKKKVSKKKVSKKNS